MVSFASSYGSSHSAIEGTVVSPRGTNGFGWDAIFQPERSSKTFAEMTAAEKNQFSMRRLAVEGLRRHLEQAPVGTEV